MKNEQLFKEIKAVIVDVEQEVNDYMTDYMTTDEASRHKDNLCYIVAGLRAKLAYIELMGLKEDNR